MMHISFSGRYTEMFTGLINGQGEILSLRSNGKETRLSIEALYALENIQLGESIAVNGTCLTVESFSYHTFTAYASAETMQRTALGQLKTGSRVNLERALAVGDRLGGHIVSGHVDCVAHVLSVRQVGESRCIRLGFPVELASEIVAKGSVALDGISLTINACGRDFLEVNVIPETWRVTTVADWKPGTSVNLETDVIGKYVHHMMGAFLPNGMSTPCEAADSPARSGLTLDYLRENGFF